MDKSEFYPRFIQILSRINLGFNLGLLIRTAGHIRTYELYIFIIHTMFLPRKLTCVTCNMLTCFHLIYLWSKLKPLSHVHIPIFFFFDYYTFVYSRFFFQIFFFGFFFQTDFKFFFLSFSIRSNYFGSFFFEPIRIFSVLSFFFEPIWFLFFFIKIL
jgi:hypothetical protein